MLERNSQRSVCLFVNYFLFKKTTVVRKVLTISVVKECINKVTS